MLSKRGDEMMAMAVRRTHQSLRMKPRLVTSEMAVLVCDQALPNEIDCPRLKRREEEMKYKLY